MQCIITEKQSHQVNNFGIILYTGDQKVYHKFKTLVGRCHIYSHIKWPFKVYHTFQVLRNQSIESLFLRYHNMSNHSIYTYSIIAAWNMY